MSFTSNMKRGTSGEDRLEVIKYIPKDLFNRFKAISALGNKARVESERTISFRVGFGQDDFILQQKPRGSRGWGPPLPLPAGLPAGLRWVDQRHQLAGVHLHQVGQVEVAVVGEAGDRREEADEEEEVGKGGHCSSRTRKIIDPTHTSC